MPTGRIIKSLSEFYTVENENSLIVCKARGKFKAKKFSPLVGDIVEFDILDNGDGIITDVHRRKNSFIRPPLANLDLMIMVVSEANPVTDPFLIDKMAVIAEASDSEFIICINKCDLNAGAGLSEIYSHTKYNVVTVSAAENTGIEELRAFLKGKVSAFTGNSGVGKSSLMNCLIAEADIETGVISDKYGRGKHTTRHTELFKLDVNTYLADTAGFSSFEITQVSDIKKENLKDYFPEISVRTGGCRYDDCNHIKEPDCAVRSSVEAGEISCSRYESYTKLYDSLSKLNPWK